MTQGLLGIFKAPPAAGGGSDTPPTVEQTDITRIDNSDTGNGIVGSAITAWSMSVDDVLIAVLTWRNTNNTDDLTGLALAKYDGTGTLGTFAIDKNYVVHHGSASTMVAIASAVCTGAGTIQIEASGYSFAAGATRRGHALILARGLDTGASRVNATNEASHSASPATTGTAATGGAGLMVAAMATQTGVTITEDAAFTLVGEDSNVSIVYRIVSADTTDQGEWTLSAGSDGAAAIVNYKSSDP